MLHLPRVPQVADESLLVLVADEDIVRLHVVVAESPVVQALQRGEDFVEGWSESLIDLPESH